MKKVIFSWSWVILFTVVSFHGFAGDLIGNLSKGDVPVSPRHLPASFSIPLNEVSKLTKTMPKSVPNEGNFPEQKTSSVEITGKIPGDVFLNDLKVGKITNGGKILIDGLESGTFIFEIRNKKGSTKQLLHIGHNQKRHFIVGYNTSGIFWEGAAIKGGTKYFERAAVACRSNKFNSGEKVTVRNEITGQSLEMEVVGPTNSGNPDVLLELSPKAAESLQIGMVDDLKGSTVTVRRNFFWQEVLPSNNSIY